MNNGYWAPIANAFARYLPTDRPFTPLEAAFSLQLDYGAGNTVTVSGYAARWSWSRGKVERFLAEIGVEIHYPAPTTTRQNQRGQIMILNSNRSRAENGQIRFVDSKDSDGEVSRKRAERKQTTSRSQGTTKKTKNKIKNKINPRSQKFGVGSPAPDRAGSRPTEPPSQEGAADIATQDQALAILRTWKPRTKAVAVDPEARRRQLREQAQQIQD